MRDAIETTIDFYDDGRVEVEAHGFTGPSCKVATSEIEKVLGRAGTVRKKKEWFRGLVGKVQTHLKART